jgi:hypothetical protein
MSFAGLVGDGGRGEMDFVSADLGKFKVPGLRDVAARAPYMHDGSLATLEDVVRYYAQGGTANLHIDRAVRPLGLSDAEVRDLVAFLEALSSDERPGLGPVPAHRPDRARVRVVDMHGKAIGGLEVEVHPFGDRLRGTGCDDRAPRALRTSPAGWIEFAYPGFTHVQLRARDYELDFDRPLPDYVARCEVVAAPKDAVLLKVTAPVRVGAMPANVTAFTPVEGSSGPGKAVALFTRVRTLRNHEALYVARARPDLGRVSVRLDYRPKGGVDALRTLDLAGGATEPIDLR